MARSAAVAADSDALFRAGSVERLEQEIPDAGGRGGEACRNRGDGEVAQEIALARSADGDAGKDEAAADHERDQRRDDVAALILEVADNRRRHGEDCACGQ
jgi:hypothetical protein